MSDDSSYEPSFDTCDSVSPACPVETTLYGDYFTLGACIVFIVWYGIALLLQVPFAWKSKAWSYAACLFVGTAFEFLGYIGRAIMSDNPWNYSAFLLQLLCLILGPSFIAAAMAVTCKHIVLQRGAEHCILKAKWIPWIFVGTDLASICVQALGGGVSSAATNGKYNASLADLGSGLLVAGVAIQAVTMIIEGLVMLHFMWRYKKAKRADPAAVKMKVKSSNIGSEHDDSKFVTFCYSIAAGFVLVIIRCIYRIPEMAAGWGSTIMKEEVSFLVLDGAMIALAVASLTIVHPAFFFPALSKDPLIRINKSDKEIESEPKDEVSSA